MKAVLVVAWFGTRTLPITKTIPKEMLPVGNKPVIQYAVEWCVNAGIQDIIMITSQQKKALEDYFDKNPELEDVLVKKGKKICSRWLIIRNHWLILHLWSNYNN